MAAANGTRNVQVKGFCTPKWLAGHTEDAAFIISDCEGYEAELFVPSVIPRLRSATIIIETHDHVVAGVSDRLGSAFGATHSVRPHGHGVARRSTSHALDFLTEQERQLTVQEVRPPQVWRLCLPNTGPNQTLEARERADELLRS